MKVYTLTTHFANNMGALLQCYALAKHINEMENCECEVLDYLPKGYNTSWSYFPKPKCVKDVLKNIRNLTPSRIFSRYRKNKEMRRFIKKYIPISSCTYNRKQIIATPPYADAIICGSDQMWNFRLFDDLTYYMDFCSGSVQTKKLSYAASIAEFWNEEQIGRIKKLLHSMDAISIRDESFVKPVSEIAEKEVSFVCDPVFLLDKIQWSKIADERYCIDEPYIFCYFIGVPDIAVRAVEALKAFSKCKVIHLNLNARDRFNSDVDVRISNPCDFVGLIKNARYVCTNSFHCTAFSIIYQKDILYLKQQKDERAETLKSIFKIPEIIIKEDMIETIKTNGHKVDYSQGFDSAQKFINKSKDFLHNCLWK